MNFIVKKEYLLFLFFSIFIGMIVAGRGDTRDTFAYYEVFKRIDSYNLLSPVQFYEKSGMEIGFGWYSYLISLFTNSPYILFLIISFFTFVYIYKTSVNVGSAFFPMILLYLSSGYFFIQQFMQIRQGLAIPLALYAISLIINKKKINLGFIFFSLLSVSFHQSAAVLLFVALVFYYFSIRLNLKLIYFKLISFLVFIVFVFLSKFVLIDLLITTSGRVESYSDSEYAEAVGLFRLPNIKSFLTFILMLVFFDEKMYRNKLITVFYLLFVVGVALRIGFSDFGILSGRLAISFTFTEIFILPFIFKKLGKMWMLFFLTFIVFQGVATYVFQAPYVFVDYFKPLF